MSEELIDKQGSGLMVGYFFPKELFPLLQSQEPDPHVTLAYFGKRSDYTSDQLVALKLVVENVAKDFATLTGSVEGIARFPASPSSDGKDVIVRLIDVPYLECLREEICEAAKAVGVMAKRNHGYTPHSTVAYVDPGTDFPISPASIPIRIDTITIAAGDQHFDYQMAPSVQKLFIPRPMDDPNSEIVNIRLMATIEKVADNQEVFGWASIIEVNGKPVEDSQGDVISESHLSKFAYDFVENCGLAGEMHRNTDGVGKMIESIVFTKEKQQVLGINLGRVGWWVGFKINDSAVWKRIKNGEYKAFSIGGRGRRLPIAA